MTDQIGLVDVSGNAIVIGGVGAFSSGFSSGFSALTAQAFVTMTSVIPPPPPSPIPQFQPRPIGMEWQVFDRALDRGLPRG